MTARPVDSGTLYLVASPIGNLEDITCRGIAVLRQVDRIACEDTRRARILLKRYELDTPLEVYHDRNQRRVTPKLMRILRAGEQIALLTDAGSPGISDPGFTLVRAAIAAGIPIVPVPGPSAVICAVIASGLPSERFAFEGYLPQSTAKRRRRIAALQTEERTVVLFVSPHRCARELAELAAALGDRPACLAREMTKLHEEFRRTSLTDLAGWARESRVRGEITLIIGGSQAAVSESAHSDGKSDRR